MADDKKVAAPAAKPAAAAARKPSTAHFDIGRALNSFDSAMSRLTTRAEGFVSRVGEVERRGHGAFDAKHRELDEVEGRLSEMEDLVNQATNGGPTTEPAPPQPPPQPPGAGSVPTYNPPPGATYNPPPGVTLNPEHPPEGPAGTSGIQLNK